MQAKTKANTELLSSDRPAQLALRLISEQMAVPTDQLARFLEIDDRRMEDLTRELLENRLCHEKRYFEGEASWLWLTRKGAELSGTGLAHRCYPPDPKSLMHRRSINDVRIHLGARAPDGRWISETMLQGQRPYGAQIPDGVFEIHGERHAIEVELSQKERSAYPKLWALNSARYDAVIYFCEDGIARRLGRLKAAGDWPKVLVRGLPRAVNPGPRRRKDVLREPDPLELDALRLMAEQGIVRIDQLGRFLKIGAAGLDRFVDGLVQANLALRKPFFEGEPEWLFNSWAGNRLCGTRLSYFRPGAGGIKTNYAFNELRLHFVARVPRATWISRRLLIDAYGRKKSHLPGAEVRVDDKRLAINFRGFGSNAPTIVPRTEVQNSRYDAVIFFCGTPQARRYMEHLQHEHRWRNVVIRSMPGPSAELFACRRAQELVEGLLGPA